MAQTALTVQFKGDTGGSRSHYGKTNIPDVTDASKVAALLDEIGDHTLCNVARTSFLTISAISFAAPAAAANVDRKAVMYFVDTLTLEKTSLTIPAPVAADVEQTPDGERVKLTPMQSIATALNTATGHAYVPTFGKVIQVQ